MTGPDRDPQKGDQGNVAQEPLQLRARPRPVTRINRKVPIGVSAMVLLIISGLVLVALRAPSLRVAAPQELFNVDHKPISDGLAKLPATYDGVQPDAKLAKQDARAPTLLVGAAPLTGPTGQHDDEAERADKTRLARMAGQARESPVFFRISAKGPPREGPNLDPRAEPLPRDATRATDANPMALSALRAAERAAALAAGDIDGLGIEASDQLRKLSFLKSGAEKEIYNPHPLQTPASPYQLMAGTVIAASLVTGLNSDLPGFVIAQVTENVFDTVSGRYLLVPQGSRLFGRYDNIVAFGQERRSSSGSASSDPTARRWSSTTSRPLTPAATPGSPTRWTCAPGSS